MDFKTSSIIENFETLIERLEGIFKSETIVGEPIFVGTTTLIPIISIVCGGGTGSSINNDMKFDNMSGGEVGISASISPDAILVIKDDKVKVLSLTGIGKLEGIFERVPEILSKIKIKKYNKNEGNI